MIIIYNHCVAKIRIYFARILTFMTVFDSCKTKLSGNNVCLLIRRKFAFIS